MDILTYALLNGKVSSVANVLDGLNSGFDYKGSVASAENLPSGASVGDTYTVTDENNEKYTWNGSEWIKTDLKYEGVTEDIDDLKDDVGNLSNLNTVDKSTIVDAVNEVLDNIYGGHYIPSYGDLATISLGTTWSGSGPYTQAVTLTGYNPSASTMVSILPDETVINQMLNDGVGQIYIKNDNGALSAVAFGGTTTAALTLYVVCAETDTTMSIEELSLKVGDLSKLKTVTKSNLVGAINEIESGMPEVTSEDNGKSLIVEDGEWALDYVKGYSKEDTLAVFYDSDVNVSQVPPDIYSAFFKPKEDPSLKYDVLYFSLDGNDPFAIPRIYQETLGVYFYGEFDFTNRMPIFTTYPLLMGAEGGYEVVYSPDNFQHITIYNSSQEMVVSEDFKAAVEKSVDIGYHREENQILFFDGDVTMSSQGNYYSTAETIAGDLSERETLDFVLDDGETITVPRSSAFGMTCYGEYNEEGRVPVFTNYPVFLMYSPPDAMIATESECHHIKISYTERNINVTDDFKEAVNYSVDLGYAYESGEPEIVIDEDVQASLQYGIYQAYINYSGDLLQYDSLCITLNNGDVVVLPKNYSAGYSAAYGDLAALMGATDPFNDYPATIVVTQNASQSPIQAMVMVYEPEDFDHTTIGIQTQTMTVSPEFEEAVETVVPKVDMNDYAPVIEAEQEHLCGIWLRDGADDYSIKSLEIEFSPRQPGEDDPSSVNVRPLYGLTKYDILVTDFINRSFEITRSGTGVPSPENPMPIIPALSFERDDGTTERFYKGSFWNDYYSSVSGIFAYSTSVHSSKISDGTWTMPATSIFKCQFDDAGTWYSNIDCLRYSSIYETTSMFANETTLLSSLQNNQIGAVGGQAPLYIKDTRYTDVESFITAVGDEIIYYPPQSTVDEDESFSLDEGLRALDAIGYEKYVKHEIDWEQTAGTIYGGKITIDEKGNVTVTKEWENIASYNNETLPGEWMSSKDVYAEGTTPTVGAQVAYKLVEPSTSYQFTIDPIKTYYKDNVVEGCGPDTLQLKYRVDTGSNFKNYVKKTDIAGLNNTGAVRVNEFYGIKILSYGALQINPATAAKIKAGTDPYMPIVPSVQQNSVFYGLAAAAGDTTQKSSNNAVGTYTDTAKTKIMEMLGIATVTVTGTDPVIVAEAGKRYICGEIATLTFTPPASGITDVVFTSGTTPTVISLLPADGVKMTETWETPLDASTTYELNFLDRKGVFVKWT